MAAHPDVDRSLRYIRALSRGLRDDLAGLPPEGWDRPTTCPPWTVRQLAAHVVTGGETFRLAVERGLDGVTEPVLSGAERERLIREAAESSPGEQLDRLERATDELEALYERLSADDLEVICYHRRGNRSARWYIQHRLAEVAFHAWDLRRSLGLAAAFPQDVAELLLPTLLESNLPRIYPSGPRGTGRFRLVAEGPTPTSWLLAASPERLAVEREGAGGADVTISAAPAVLALLVYGRADLAEEERHGRARVEGDRALAARFHDIFPGP
jgi:uncharacterized protein (TIGR03083 family)